MNNSPEYHSGRYGHVGAQEVPDNSERLEQLIHGGDEDGLLVVVEIIVDVSIDVWS